MLLYFALANGLPVPIACLAPDVAAPIYACVSLVAYMTTAARCTNRLDMHHSQPAVPLAPERDARLSV